MSVTEESAVGGDSPAPEEELPPLRKNRDFLMLWLGAGAALLGVRVATVAYPLLAVWHGGSTVGAGLVGFAALLPQLLVQLPAGVLVDRCDRRRVMIVCDLLSLLAMGSVAVALVLGHFSVVHLMVAAFVEGAAAIVYRLCERAAVRNVVHEKHLSAALSQNEARAQTATLLGQPAGSVLYTGAKWLPFAFAAVAHLTALVTLLFIKKEFQKERTKSSRDLRAELVEGIVWVWRQRFVRAASLIIAGSNILFQVLSLAIVVVIKEDGGSPAAIGIIGAVAGVGGICGALTGSWWMRHVKPHAIMIGSITAWAVFMTAMAFTAQPVLLGALYAGLSYAAALLNVAGGVYQVRITPDHMQGRATSVGALLASGANSAGAMAGGFLLASWTTTNTLLAVGIAMALMAIAAAVSPAVRSVRDMDLAG